MLRARVTTAPCVPPIRKAVAEWRKEKYKGATATTKSLLNYWFGTGCLRRRAGALHLRS